MLRKWHEMRKPTELRPKGQPEEFAVCRIESAIAQPVIRAGESDHARFAGSQQGGLQRDFDRLKARVAKSRLARDNIDFGLWTLDLGLRCRPPFECDAT